MVEMAEKGESIDPAWELMGQIMDAQIGATQKLSNDLADMGWQAAQEWADRYATLYDAVERLNDSVRVDRVLRGVGFIRDAVEGDIEHYEHMKMGGR